jgi:pyruvate/2-oxoglutarate dehydrogenase complex dihydrolipoamide acyltransferase (E2) component
MSRRRQTIAQRLVEAQRTAAMLTTFNEADMSTIMELRTRRRDAFLKRHGVSLEYTVEDFEREGHASARLREKRQAEIANAAHR